jgi:GAF domain-containing protein
MLNIIILAATLFPVISLLAGALIEPLVGMLVIIFIAISIGISILIRFGHLRSSVIILGFVWWVLFTFGISYFGGLHDTAITGFFFLLILVSIIRNWGILLLFGSLSVISFIGVYIAEQFGIIQPDINIPSDAADLAMPIAVMGASIFVLRVLVRYLTSAYDRARENATILEEINLELQESRDDLAHRAKELERRTRYLEATASVARDVASELNPNTLLQRVVNRVTEQFNFYHTGLFLIEPGGEYAVLRAASSQGGKRMLERGHRLRVGQEGIVGHVASQGISRIALDTGAEAVYFDNPDLPQTRSEAALPLLARGNLIGVLDVQSNAPEAFDADDISVLQTLADQISVALQTAQLFQQVEESLEAQRRAYGDVSREAWRRITSEQEIVGYQYIHGDVVSVKDSPILESPELPEVSLPIQIGGQVVGHITAHKPEGEATWLPDEIAVLETLTNQLSVALDSARLYQDTQRRAEREQLSSEITTRIRETLDIETVIKTASEEIRRALNLPEVVIRLGEPPSSRSEGASK